MVKVQAWEQLHDYRYSGKLNTEEFHELLLEAGYPPDAAQKAANERGWQRLEAGLKL